MAETLGSLCDKLTIVKLKEYHSDDSVRLDSLKNQSNQLQEEINEFIGLAINGDIPLDKLFFNPNKIYKKEGNPVREFVGSIAEIFSNLATVNCELWHEQEKVYEFETVLAEEKNAVVKQLAILNLERNECIKKIDTIFQENIKSLNGKTS